jgi:hypothetical protein
MTPAERPAPGEIAPAIRLRDAFLGWQCRLRQLAMRQAEGRPSTGMRPRVIDGGEGEIAAVVTVLLVPRDPEPVTDRFRHMMRRSHDPARRREDALKLLAADYYQGPGDFSDDLTALFGPQSEVANRLLEAGACRLDFDQYAQRYEIPCGVAELEESDPAWQLTFWHNSLFNPGLPRDVCILTFKPDWNRATADPPSR